MVWFDFLCRWVEDYWKDRVLWAGGVGWRKSACAYSWWDTQGPRASEALDIPNIMGQASETHIQEVGCVNQMHLNLLSFKKFKLTYGVDFLRGERREAYLILWVLLRSCWCLSPVSFPGITYCSDLVLAQSSFARSSMGPCGEGSLPLPICYYSTYIVLSSGSTADILPKSFSIPPAQPN